MPHYAYIHQDKYDLPERCPRFSLLPLFGRREVQIPEEPQGQMYCRHVVLHRTQLGALYSTQRSLQALSGLRGHYPAPSGHHAGCTGHREVARVLAREDRHNRWRPGHLRLHVHERTSHSHCGRHASARKCSSVTWRPACTTWGACSICTAQRQCQHKSSGFSSCQCQHQAC